MQFAIERKYKMKKKYEKPCLEVLNFLRNEDVVTTSNQGMNFDPENPNGEGGKTEW